MGSWREGLCLSQSSRCPDRVTRNILPTSRSEVGQGGHLYVFHCAMSSADTSLPYPDPGTRYRHDHMLAFGEPGTELKFWSVEQGSR